MSKKGNPAVIGGFVLTAIVLAVVAIGVLGAVKFNSREQEFVMFFAESINGLEPGSKVKAQGITIGKVTDVRLRHRSMGENNVAFDNQKDTKRIFVNGQEQMAKVSLIPVYVNIDMTRLDELDVLVDGEVKMEEIRKLCEQTGLRAQLQTENMISGVKFIEINFFTEEQLRTKFEASTGGQAFFGQVYPRMPEIPTVPSFQKSAEQLFDSFSKLDVEAIQDTLLSTMNSLRGVANAAETRISGFDTETVSANLSSALKSFDETVVALKQRLDDPQIDVTMQDMRKTLASVTDLAEDIKIKVGPVLVELEQTNKDAQNALQALESASNRMDGALAPEGALRVDLHTALNNISQAAESISRLVDYLERNPNALITGRAPNKIPQK